MSQYRRHVSNKWAKHEVLRRGSRLSRYMPKTRRMSLQNLVSMLRQYRMVYVKPVAGSMGRGVMRVTLKSGKIQCRIGAKKRTFSGLRGAYSYILKVADGESYMVQQGIRMMKYRGRPFDIRVMVQRTRRKTWKVTGWAVRVAHPAKVVTNGSQGGTIYPLGVVVPQSRRMARKLKRIGNWSARRLHSYWPGLNTIGLDVAVDRNRKPWILEANTSPDPCPFTKLPNRRMLRRILQYDRANGRTHGLRCIKSHRGR